MKDANITVRVDSKLKTNIETACEYFGETVTSVIRHAFRQKIDQYYKARAIDTETARNIADGDNFQLMFEAAKREAYILQKLGFDNVFKLVESADATKQRMFYEFLLKEKLKDFGLSYTPSRNDSERVN